MSKVYFYPHSYLRDRQLETIRKWSSSEVVNPEIALNRVGNQVDKKKALSLIVKSRLKINIQNNLISKKKDKIFLSQKGRYLLNFFSYVVKIFKLKIYE